MNIILYILSCLSIASPLFCAEKSIGSILGPAYISIVYPYSFPSERTIPLIKNQSIHYLSSGEQSESDVSELDEHFTRTYKLKKRFAGACFTMWLNEDDYTNAFFQQIFSLKNPTWNINAQKLYIAQQSLNNNQKQYIIIENSNYNPYIQTLKNGTTITYKNQDATLKAFFKDYEMALPAIEQHIKNNNKIKLTKRKKYLQMVSLEKVKKNTLKWIASEKKKIKNHMEQWCWHNTLWKKKQEIESFLESKAFSSYYTLYDNILNQAELDNKKKKLEDLHAILDTIGWPSWTQIQKDAWDIGLLTNKSYYRSFMKNKHDELVRFFCFIQKEVKKNTKRERINIATTYAINVEIIAQTTKEQERRQTDALKRKTEDWELLKRRTIVVGALFIIVSLTVKGIKEIKDTVHEIIKKEPRFTIAQALLPIMEKKP